MHDDAETKGFEAGDSVAEAVGKQRVFISTLGKGGKYWVTPLMGDVPNEVIWSLWEKPI